MNQFDLNLWLLVLTDAQVTLPQDIGLLQTLYAFPNYEATVPELAAIMRGKHFVTINGQPHRWAKRIAKKYAVELPKIGYWNLFFDGYSSVDGFIWQLTPDLITALERTGLSGDVRLSEAFLRAEIDVFSEGARQVVQVNRYERNPDARRACLAHYGFACVVCGIDFEQKYGELGRGFIHVHHLVPLSTIGEEYVVDPIADLRPVCPNCHAMLHRQHPPLSIGELQSRLQV